MNSFERTIHTQAQLEATWSELITPLGFADPRFWIMLIEPDGRPVPQLVQIDELAGPPRPDDVERGAAFLRMLTDEVGPPDARVAFLYGRPGTSGLQASDRAWAAALAAMARGAGLVCEIVHVANDVRIVPVPLDELDAA